MPTTNTANTARSFVSTRRFGVEIEFCTDKSRVEIETALNDAGISVRAEGYNHTTRSYWKIVPDGSVSNGFELVSPPLSGVQGIEEVKRAAAALVEAGCTVDTSCGLHVHVDAAGLDGATVVHILRRYTNHERQIDAMVPSHRRRNSYAESVRGDLVNVEEYLRSNPAATAQAVCNRVRDRYRKVNVTAFLVHGTIEFRQHSGSIDGTKIANWIMFCVTFVEDSKVTLRTVTTTPAPVQAAAPSPVTPAGGRTLASLMNERLAGNVPTSPFAQTFPRERVNARSRNYRRLLELFIAQGCYRSVSASLIASTLEISEASVPSYISNFREVYPTVDISAFRGRGYYTTSSDRTLQAALNPAGVQAPVAAPAPVVQAPPPAPVTVTVVDLPVDRGLFANLPRAVEAFYQERAVDFLG